MIQRRHSECPGTEAPWTAYGTWEMGEFYRDLRSTVLQLEAAHANGELAAELEDPGVAQRLGHRLFGVYEALAAEAPRGRTRPEARKPVVLALLEQLRDEVFRVDHWGGFQVQLETASTGREAATKESNGSAPLFETSLGDGPPVLQRLDQIVARRFWAIGFLSEDIDLTDAVAREAARLGVERLSRDLVDLARVLRRAPTSHAPMIPSHQDRAFEQLMLDILVENQPRARAARLREDFCQKTDLRVHYAGLERSRGARVQVKATANLVRHEQRLADIRRREHLVILSPVRLAEYIDEEMHGVDGGLLDHDLLRAFWDSLPDQPHDIAGLSYSIREVLQLSLTRPSADPRGPLGSVPAALRAIVRAFVRRESFRATAALRRDLDSGAEVREKTDGRLHFRSAPSARDARSVSACAKPTGTDGPAD